MARKEHRPQATQQLYLSRKNGVSVIFRAKLMHFEQALDVVTNQIQHAHKIDV